MMTKRIALSSAVLALLAAGPARAAPVTPGFGASLRLGYAIPMGTVDNDNPGQDLSKFVSGGIPIQLDLGYRFTPNLSAAVFGSYAFDFIGSDLDNACKAQGVDCSGGHDIRVGIEAFWHFMPGESIDPWAGVGVGYEWNKLNVAGGGQSFDLTAKGWEFVNLQLGADFALASVMPGLGVGPFVQFSLGQYSTESLSGPGTDTSRDVNSKATHEWLTFGVRGTWNL